MDTNTRANLACIGRSEYRAILALLADYDDAMAAVEQSGLSLDEAGETETAILESPLSVEVRSGWYAPGAEDDADPAAEYRIMLSWGGPAARIVGDLDVYGQPETATLEVQDWGTPWTEYTGDDPDVLLRYARFFYYGG